MEPAMTEQRVEFVVLIFAHGNSHALDIMRSLLVSRFRLEHTHSSLEQSKGYTSYGKRLPGTQRLRRRWGEASFLTIFPLSHTSFECSTPRYLWMNAYFRRRCAAQSMAWVLL
jgi:hypothetical protein